MKKQNIITAAYEYILIMFVFFAAKFFLYVALKINSIFILIKRKIYKSKNIGFHTFQNEFGFVYLVKEME